MPHAVLGIVTEDATERSESQSKSGIWQLGSLRKLCPTRQSRERDRVDPGGAARRDVGGGDADGNHDRGGTGDRAGVGRAQPEQQDSSRPVDAPRRRNTEHEADRRPAPATGAGSSSAPGRGPRRARCGRRSQASGEPPHMPAARRARSPTAPASRCRAAAPGWQTAAPGRATAGSAPAAIRTLKIGSVPSSPRSVSRTVPASAIGSPAVRTANVIRLNSPCWNGK